MGGPWLSLLGPWAVLRELGASGVEISLLAAQLGDRGAGEEERIVSLVLLWMSKGWCGKETKKCFILEKEMFIF